MSEHIFAGSFQCGSERLSYIWTCLFVSVASWLSYLSTNVLQIWNVELGFKFGVPARPFIETTDAVSHPFPSDKNRTLDVEREEVMFKGTPMLVCHHVLNDSSTSYIYFRNLLCKGNLCPVDYT